MVLTHPKLITMAHGGGGVAMRDLIDEVFVKTFGYTEMTGQEDQARMAMPEGQLAFTTDSFVVSPLFFPGGDIGSLAVNGTVNDLAVGGARPLVLSCAVIIEEGLPVETLQRIVVSMKGAADRAGVQIVTGDTKVVEKGSADGLFITTSGIGVLPSSPVLAATKVRPGDAVIVNGVLGNHGAAILNARGDLHLEADILSDCAPLNHLMEALLTAVPETRAARDATRGGLASTLNEIAAACGAAIVLDETALPIRDDVKGFCEILGLDPLYLANEGTLVTFVPEAQVDTALAAMKSVPEGEKASVIGWVVEGSPIVTLKTLFGGERVVDMLVGDQLPRIC